MNELTSNSSVMNILVACEESQAVTKAFRAKGHNAFSCDILDCSGGYPEYHIKSDVIPLLDGFCKFDTCSGNSFNLLSRWDMIIIDVLTDDEISKIFECYPDGSNSIHLRNRVIISLMLDCGLRLSEVVNVKYSQLYIKDGYIIVTGKGNKSRAVSFGGYTKKHLMNYLSCFNPLFPAVVKSDSLFVTSESNQISQNTIKKIFRKLKDITGIERLHPHLLRHTFATRYLENGGDIYTLKNLLGHTTLAQTIHYLHIAENRIHKDYSLFSPLDNLSGIR